MEIHSISYRHFKILIHKMTIFVKIKKKIFCKHFSLVEIVLCNKILNLQFYFAYSCFITNT